VSAYLHPFKEDLVRFDFEVDGEGEELSGFLLLLGGEDDSRVFS
jgi:hypothetical protein